MGAVEDQMLVDLVGHRQQVVTAADLGDGLQLRPVKDLAGRVVGCVEQDQAGSGGDRGGQPVRIEGPCRRLQRHHPASGSR